MTTTINYFSKVTLVLFVTAHLINHSIIVAGPQQYLAFMDAIRPVYRHPVAESLLLLAVIVQIVSGVAKSYKRRGRKKDIYSKLQLYAGLYLSVFLLFHVTAVMAGRYFYQLDTNLYYGATGLNAYPHLLFFIPYYGMGIIAFFTYVGCSLRKPLMRVSNKTIYLNAVANFTIIVGAALAVIILFHMTNLEIPPEYLKSIGR